jgi:tetratricopeptide (TPR) repeat protein
MTRIACLMMQKDEALLLRPWLLYHGHLFGFENLFVYDNGSTDAAVLATLREFAAVGVRVDYAHARPEDFEDKGQVIGARIAAFRDADCYDIALPMDCDEFLAIEGERGPACDRAAVLAELARIDAGGATCRTAYCLDNRPGHLDLFRCVPHVKSLVVVRAFRDIDHGFHQAGLPPGQSYGETGLIHLHLHFKPFPLLLESAANKLRPFVDVNDRMALAEFAGVGDHLKRYFFLSAAEFHADLRGYTWPLLRFGGLSRILGVMMDLPAFRSAWEAGRPVEARSDALVIELDQISFIKAAYLDANPDLAGAEGSPFLHFVRAGFEEGRRLEASPAGWEEVAARLADIRAIRPDGRAGYAGVALALSPLGRGQEADALFEAAITRFGETNVVLREYALSAMYQEHHATAADRWSRLRNLYPDDPDGYRYGALAWRRAGDLERAAKVAHAGLALFPDDAEIQREFGEITRDSGNAMTTGLL